MNQELLLTLCFLLLIFAAALIAVWVEHTEWAQVFLTEVQQLLPYFVKHSFLFCSPKLFSLQSGAVLLFGCLVGGLVFLFNYAFDWNILDLSPSRFSSLFNEVFLPFIIFSSGFTMQKVFHVFSFSFSPSNLLHFYILILFSP